jgi:hypothetical protein
MQQHFKSKPATFFATIGLVGGIFYTFRKGESMNKVLLTGGVFGICGLLAGAAISKLYE